MTAEANRNPDLERLRYAERIRASFVEHVHALVAAGYARLDKGGLATAEEPAITGDLAKAMTEVAEDPASPRWAARYEIHDDPPQNVNGLKGKRRPRVDLEIAFISGQSGKRPRFQFEAKRLYRSDSVSEYVGSAGLGMILDGRYARDHSDAGMLGYVQEGLVSEWVDKIGNELNTNKQQYALCDGGDFAPFKTRAISKHLYRSHHARQNGASPVSVSHLFLAFN